ncbi:hypothetical protein PFISCL1PPCAC_18898, partial [Pristionchus fissidentatus]
SISEHSPYVHSIIEILDVPMTVNNIFSKKSTHQCGKIYGANGTVLFTVKCLVSGKDKDGVRSLSVHLIANPDGRDPHWRISFFAECMLSSRSCISAWSGESNFVARTGANLAVVPLVEMDNSESGMDEEEFPDDQLSLDILLSVLSIMN